MLVIVHELPAVLMSCQRSFPCQASMAASVCVPSWGAVAKALADVCAGGDAQAAAKAVATATAKVGLEVSCEGPSTRAAMASVIPGRGPCLSLLRVGGLGKQALSCCEHVLTVCACLAAGYRNCDCQGLGSDSDHWRWPGMR